MEGSSYRGFELPGVDCKTNELIINSYVLCDNNYNCYCLAKSTVQV